MDSVGENNQNRNAQWKETNGTKRDDNQRAQQINRNAQYPHPQKVPQYPIFHYSSALQQHNMKREKKKKWKIDNNMLLVHKNKSTKRK